MFNFWDVYKDNSNIVQIDKRCAISNSQKKKKNSKNSPVRNVGQLSKALITW